MGSSSKKVEKWSDNRWMDEGAVDFSSEFSSNDGRINSGESSGTNQARIIEGRPRTSDQYNQGRVTSHESHCEDDHNRRPNHGETTDQNGEASDSKTIRKYATKNTIHNHNQRNTNKKKQSLNHGNEGTQHDSGMATKFTKDSSHKKARPKVRQVSQPKTKVMYKCKLCNIHLPTRYSRTQHRDQRHPEFLGCSIFKKVAISIEKPKPLHVGKKTLASRNIPASSKTSERKDAKVHANIRLQEKKLSFAFKCNICNVILKTKYGTRQHRKKQHSNLDAKRKLFTKLPVEDVGSTSAVEPERKRKVDGAGECGTAKSRKTLHKPKDRAQPDRIPVSTLNQCDVCTVFFTSEREAADHTAACSKDITNINIICCHICEKPFLREDLKVHRDRDHGHNNEIKIIRIRASNQERPVLHQRVIKQKLFHCNDCNAHFLTYGVFMTHMRRNIHNKKVSTCEACGYSFLIKTLNLHMTKHHREKSLGREDFLVWTLTSRGRWAKAADCDGSLLNKNTCRYNNNDGSVVGHEQREEEDSSTTTPGITLHKCEMCNVHFDDESSCRQHVTEHVPLDYWDYMACPECGLRFENQALLRHRELHRKNIALDKAVIASYQPINTSTNVEIPGGRPIKTKIANGTSEEAVDAAAKPACETNRRLLDRNQVEVSIENRRIIIEEGNSERPNHSEPSEGPQTAEVAHRNDIVRRSIKDDKTMCWVADYENIGVKQELLPANSSDAFDKDIQDNTNKQIISAKSIISKANMIKVESSEKHDDSNTSQCIKIETELNKEFNIINGSSATESEFYVRVKADSVSDEGSNTDGRIGQNVKKRQSADMHSTSVRRISLTANDKCTQQPSTSTSICTKPRKFDRSSIQTSTYLNAEERELNTISKGTNLPTCSVEKNIKTQLRRACMLLNIPSASTSPDSKKYKTTNQLESTAEDIQRSGTGRRVPLITGNQITTTNDGSNERIQSKQAHNSNIKSTKDQEKSKLDEGDNDVVVSNEEISIVIDSDSDIDERENMMHK